MNPILIGQLIQALEFAIAQGVALQQNNAWTNTVKPGIVAALAENRPMTDAELAPIHDGAQSAHDELASA